MIQFVCLFFSLDEVSRTGCYLWLGDAESCIPVISIVWVLTIWYPIGLVLWYSSVFESVLPLQRLRAWSPVLCRSIYSFPLVRHSPLLSAGVLHALLCLKVYSWCICDERYIPCPPTPPPSCSPLTFFFKGNHISSVLLKVKLKYNSQNEPNFKNIKDKWS